jgi:hypothetical protein
LPKNIPSYPGRYTLSFRSAARNLLLLFPINAAIPPGCPSTSISKHLPENIPSQPTLPFSVPRCLSGRCLFSDHQITRLPDHPMASPASSQDLKNLAKTSQPTILPSQVLFDERGICVHQAAKQFFSLLNYQISHSFPTNLKFAKINLLLGFFLQFGFFGNIRRFWQSTAARSAAGLRPLNAGPRSRRLPRMAADQTGSTTHKK